MRTIFRFMFVLTALIVAPCAQADDEPAPDRPANGADKPSEYKPRDFGLSLRDQATKAMGTGNHKEAAALFARWLEADPKDSNSWYNYACSLSLLGQKDEALRAFETCVDAGFEGFDHAKKDPDLESIRSDARFDRAIARGLAKGGELPDMKRHHVTTETLGSFIVLLPPDYEKGKAAYPLCVLLHGSGSSEINHGAVSERLGREGVVYVVPRALHPHISVIKQTGKPGFTVWPPDKSDEEDASDPMGLHSDFILRCVKHAQGLYRVAKGRVHVWGHSQGAASAMVFAARNPQHVESVFAFAGYYPDQHITDDAIKAWKDQDVHISLCHGKKDAVVPYAPTIEIAKRLGNAGVKCGVFSVSGGHRIEPEVDQAGLGWARKHVLKVPVDPKAPENDLGQTFLPLGDKDRASLDKMRAWVQGHMGDDAKSRFTQSAEKLSVIATILEKGWIKPKETVKLQSLGVVFGDVIASEAGLDWMVVSDQYGRTPALRYAETSIVMFPMTMISKRVERGETVDVYALLGKTLKGVAGIKKQLALEAEKK